MPRRKRTSRRTRSHLARKLLDYEPPGWLSTEELEQELFQAVVAETRCPRSQASFERIDVTSPRTNPGPRFSIVDLSCGSSPNFGRSSRNLRAGRAHVNSNPPRWFTGASYHHHRSLSAPCGADDLA